jgi:serine protease AprX
MRKENIVRTRLGWRWLTALGLATSLLAGILVTDSAKAQNIKRSTSARTSLSKYTLDLTAAAEQGHFDSSTDRRDEINRAVEILSGLKQNNPVVLSDSPAVRDLVASGVARRIVTGDVPEAMYGKRLLKLNLDALFHDSKTADDLINNISAILSEVAQSDAKIILLVDPIQSLMGQSSAFDGAASAMLRDALTNGGVQFFGASTEVTFKENVANDESLAALFTGVEMQEVADATQQTNPQANEPAKTNQEEFVGDNVSADLRALIDGRNAPARVKAILQVNDTNSQALQAQLSRYGVNIESRMPQFGALAVDIPTKAIEKIADSGNYLSLDRPINGLGHVEQTTGEDAMLAQPGNSSLDGSSIGVAIVDSGVSTKMKSLAGRIVYSKDFTGEGTTNDFYGHGTFVASMIAAQKGSYGGVAPGANIVNFRVLNSQGNGSMSSLLAALNAVMSNRNTYNIRVVNVSLGAAAVDSYKNDPVCRAVRRLVDAGIVVVAAAGNEGKDALHPKVYGRIHSPGNEPSAITVGASNTFGTDVRSDDGVTSYSSRGPTRSYWKDEKGVKHYDDLIKPDLVAPGNKIIGAAAPNNLLLQLNPELLVSSGNTNNGKGTMRLSGTSVSTPIVAGAAAVLLEANPSLTPNLIKMILMYTAQPLAKFNTLEQGAGQLNIEGAVRLAKLVRKDLSASTKLGDPLLTSAPPSPQSTISGQTVTWSQGVLFNYDWAKGSELITEYQKIYGLGVLLSDGVLMTDGVLICDAKQLSGGILVSDDIMISNGITMGDGTLVSDRVGTLLADRVGTLLADGTFIADGILLSDGTLVSDRVGTLVADGTLISDTVLRGDATTCMAAE